jgi:hypothetical protein
MFRSIGPRQLLGTICWPAASKGRSLYICLPRNDRIYPGLSAGAFGNGEVTWGPTRSCEPC